jgi:hypothetical protein
MGKGQWDIFYKFSEDNCRHLLIRMTANSSSIQKHFRLVFIRTLKFLKRKKWVQFFTYREYQKKSSCTLYEELRENLSRYNLGPDLFSLCTCL